MLERLLVPLDGSERGELALEYARDLAIGLGSEVRLVCATEKKDAATLNVCNIYLSRLIDKMAAQIKAANPKASLHNIVLEGVAADVLLRYAADESIGLIILTSHGHGGIMPWSMGSTADRIMHHSHTPVLMVRTAYKPRSKDSLFSRILLPLDGSPLGEAALPYVQHIASALGSEVVLLMVVETIMRVHSLGGPDHIVFSEQQVEQMKQEAAAYLEGASKCFPKGKVRTMVRTGDPAQEILKASADEAASLTAMSSHGKSGVSQWMLGSVTNKILHADKVPFLLVRPPAKIG